MDSLEAEFLFTTTLLSVDMLNVLCSNKSAEKKVLCRRSSLRLFLIAAVTQ